MTCLGYLTFANIMECLQHGVANTPERVMIHVLITQSHSQARDVFEQLNNHHL